MPRVPPRLTANARDLRRRATDAERILWNRLRAYRPRFTRQFVIGPYIVDLACREARIAIELDGSQHVDSARDVSRTAFLEGLGWRVMRFWNSEVAENSDGVAEAILAAVSERIETHPRPLPVSREGRSRRPRTRVSSEVPGA
jgi:BirA family biotin operon repressor/biotin-[acetyl-CoA-carboxylase] ligase